MFRRAARVKVSVYQCGHVLTPVYSSKFEALVQESGGMSSYQEQFLTKQNFPRSALVKMRTSSLVETQTFPQQLPKPG